MGAVKTGYSLKLDLEEAVLDVDPALAPSVMRRLGGKPKHDEIVDALPLPQTPLWLAGAVRLLRIYRRHISPRLGHRCVYEPSCSRYSELAFRRFGFWRGLRFTAGRLARCRPGRGGVDLSHIGE